MEIQENKITYYTKDGTNKSIHEIMDSVRENVLGPQYKIVILYPDETEKIEIDLQDIEEGSISYSDTYQQGERKSLSFTLFNVNNKYTPSPNNARNRMYYNNKETINNQVPENEIWGDLKFAFYEGVNVYSEQIWLQKGVFTVKSIGIDVSDTLQTINFSLGDKFSILSGKQGTLLDTYEIPVGNNLLTALRDLLNMPMGNGYIYDYKPIIADNSFIDMKCQATIRKEAGDTIASVIDDIATQMSANYYYNDNGNFMLEFLNETTFDNKKPICWNFYEKYSEIFGINQNYDFSSAINVIKVVGDNMNTGVYSKLVTNEDSRSPICVQRIGYRKEPPINNCNIWSTTLANDLATYYLRKKSITPLEMSLEVRYNPLLIIDHICTIDYDSLNYKKDKFVITSISVSSGNNNMSLKVVRIEDLDFLKMGGDYNGI